MTRHTIHTLRARALALHIHLGASSAGVALVLFGLLAAAGASSAAGPAQAQDDTATRFKQERAACMARVVPEERETCLREATAAKAENQRRGLDVDAGKLQGNRLQRCNPLPDDQRRDCIARINGEGTASGSVAGGGIYRELVRREPAGPSASAPSRVASAASR